LIYKLTGIDEEHEMKWTEYAIAMLVFSFVTMMVTYAIERLQHVLPLNPQGFANVAPDLAMNTAASFTTNTNWQSYVPEATMSYLTQMVTLAYHNFASAAVGMALAIAFVRGIAGREKKTLGQLLGRYDPCDAVGAAAGKPGPRAGAGLAGSRAELPPLRHGEAGAADAGRR
jgi:K+-transporting ATPase ATPase A chain